MILKFKLLTLNFSIATLLLLFLCLGSQNLEKRYKINFITNETVELPNGFIIGVSFVIGVISGGLSSTLLLKDKDSIGN
tara:strand:- start:1186 stop:1422 length:237 start_codon:yes stop_codon:yes gene_type:complete